MKNVVHRTFRSWLLAVCAGLLATAATCGHCGNTTERITLADLPAKRGYHLRTGFDDDPSDFIGRFLNDGIPAAEIDESDGVQTICSQYIEHKEVGAGGTYDEVYSASSTAGASLNIAPVAKAAGASGNASAEARAGTKVRVKFELTKKMRGVKTNEYFDCCRQNVNGCSGRYLSEFWAGTGAIYEFAGSQEKYEGETGVPGVTDGSIEFKNGVAWKRAMTFDDHYFAFTTAPGLEDDCGWVDVVPTSDKGQFFVGVSPRVLSEAEARTLAMRDARKKAVRYLGEYIKATVSAQSNAMDGYVRDEEVLTAMAEGLVRHVKGRRYCPAQTSKSPKGRLYKSRVLAFLPEEKKAEAAEESIDTVEEELDRKGELTPDERQKLEKLKTDIGRIHRSSQE